MTQHQSIRLMETHDDGAEVHLMGAGWERQYKTNKALVIPQTNETVPHYDTLADVPHDLPEGTKGAVSRDAVGAPVDNQSEIFNEALDDGGHPIKTAGARPQFEFTVLSIIGLIIISILAAAILFTISSIAWEAFNPSCIDKQRVIQEMGEKSVIQTADCSVYKCDKESGECQTIHEGSGGAGGGGLPLIGNPMFWVVAGIAGLVLLTSGD